MSFCSNCGNKYEDGDKFCPGCGCDLITGESMSSSETTKQANKLLTIVKEGGMYYKDLIIHNTETSDKLFADNRNSIPFVVTLLSMIINSILYGIVIKKLYNFTSTLWGYGYGELENLLPKINVLNQSIKGMLFSVVLVILLALGLFIIAKVYNGEVINIFKIIAVASVPLTCINLIAFIVSYISFTVAVVIISIGICAAIGTIFTNSHKYITGGNNAHIAIAAVVMLSNISFCFIIIKVYSNLFLQYLSYLGNLF